MSKEMEVLSPMVVALLLGAALGPAAGSPKLPDLDAALRVARAFKYSPAEAVGLPRAAVPLPPDLAEVCRAFSWSPSEAAFLSPEPFLWAIPIPFGYYWPGPSAAFVPPPPPPMWPSTSGPFFPRARR